MNHFGVWRKTIVYRSFIQTITSIYSFPHRNTVHNADLISKKVFHALRYIHAQVPFTIVTFYFHRRS